MYYYVSFILLSTNKEKKKEEEHIVPGQKLYLKKVKEMWIRINVVENKRIRNKKYTKSWDKGEDVNLYLWTNRNLCFYFKGVKLLFLQWKKFFSV